MLQKNIFILAIILMVLLSACAKIETEKELVKKISTRAGELTLRYENGQATLSGTLQRSTPCVNWTIQVEGAKDSPRSGIGIIIYDSNAGVICIQVLGEPQEIYEEINQVSEDTTYRIQLEYEVVFSGKLE